MALRGNLRDFTVTQLLNLINLAQKTGTLVVDGPSEQAHVAFREGKLAYARIGQEDTRLATILHKANRLSVNQYRAIMERAGKMTDKELADREITVMADKTLPYAVLKKVLSTCTDAEYGRVSFALMQKDKPVEAGTVRGS